MSVFSECQETVREFNYFSGRPSHFVVMHKVGELRCFVKSELYFHGHDNLEITIVLLRRSEDLVQNINLLVIILSEKITF